MGDDLINFVQLFTIDSNYWRWLYLLRFITGPGLHLFPSHLNRTQIVNLSTVSSLKHWPISLFLLLLSLRLSLPFSLLPPFAARLPPALLLIHPDCCPLPGCSLGRARLLHAWNYSPWELASSYSALSAARPSQAFSRTTSRQHLAPWGAARRRQVRLGSIVDSQASLPCHMLPSAWCVLPVCPTCSSESPLTSLKESLSPAKSLLPSFLPPVTSLVHTSCYMCIFVSCSAIYSIGRLSRFWARLGQGQSFFVFIHQLSTYNKHLISASWMNGFISLCILRV